MNSRHYPTREELIHLDRKILTKIVRDTAQEVWASMTNDQKTLVRFGMFPAEIMEKHKDLEDRDLLPIILSAALMDCAQKDGGMRA